MPYLWERNEKVMRRRQLTNYSHTIYASYLGCISQAIVNNFAPLLFLTFQSSMALSIQSITLITTVNFLVQLLVDLICARYVDKIGYRTCLVSAHICAALGLVGLAVLPKVIQPYTGIMVSVVLYAIGGGIIEVLVSPVVEACPTEKKEAAMSLLHSFYCWGHVAVVLLSTAFFHFVGIENWAVLACIWAAIPVFNGVYYSLVPLYPIVSEEKKMSLGGLLKQKIFWLLIVMMVCSGASEQAVGQWVSAFAESALNVSKTMGDLLGVCSFAALMGTARAIYGKYSDGIPLKSMMIFSSLMCIGCYCLAAFTANPIAGLLGCGFCGFSVGIFWPGTFSTAMRVLPGGGTAMYAFMALAGDLGCSSGPTVVGMVADAAGGDLRKGIAVALVFPIVMLISTCLIGYRKEN